MALRYGPKGFVVSILLWVKFKSTLLTAPCITSSGPLNLFTTKSSHAEYEWNTNESSSNDFSGLFTIEGYLA